ncbi:hypothetical protein ABPG75_003603 [Micractinium tetrahymenae]
MTAEADWEASKENYQPLKQGRKASGLRDVTGELRAKEVEERRRAFWEELAGYTGPDPLEVWLRFIKWTQEAFAAGGHKAELLPLLERCTRELQADGRYAADIRYLRVWIQYADCLPDPGDVFAFLKENDIGQEHALYYIAYATYLEARGGYAKADAVYQQGINRLAAPVERLRAKFAEFQQRMARRIQRKAAEQAAGEAAEPEHPERRSLGLLGGRAAAGSRANAAAGGGARPGGGLLLGGGGGLLGKRKTAAPAGGDQENVGGSGLDIFVDEEFSSGGAGAASAPAALFQPGRSAAAPWTKLGGFEAGRKENVQRASVWAGQKVKQSAAHSAPAAPALEIFVDPELQEAETQAAGDGSAAKPTLRQRLDRGGGALPEEAIMQDPLHLHKAQASVPLQGGVPARPAAQPEAKRRREEVMAFSEAALAGDSGEELCFEEVRAVRWLQQRREEEQAAAAVAANTAQQGEEEDLPDMELETCAIMAVGEAGAARPEAQAAAAEASGMDAEQAQPAGLECCPAPAAAAAGPAVTEAADPAAFGSPVAAEELGQAQPGAAAQSVQQPADDLQAQAGPAAVAAEQAASTAAQAGPAPDSLAAAEQQLAAHPTRFEQPADAEAAAGAALEQPGRFEAALAAAFGQQPDEHGAGFEPTMTLSTRDALAAINQMFGGSLPADAAQHLATASGSGSGAFASGASAGSSGAFAVGGGGGYEPTMTIATRDAFAALNKMFKGSLPLEHGSLPPNPYAEPTLHLGRSGLGPEPTFTISTRAAFEAINQMFGGSGAAAAATVAAAAAAPAGQQQGRQQQQAEGGFRVPAPRPPRARPPAAAPQAPAAGPADSPGGFMIREDTQFVSVPVEAMEAEAAAAPAAAAAAAAQSPAGGFGGGFCIREDTQFITVPAGAGSDEEEDGVEGAAGPGGAAAAQQASPAAGFGGSFCIREDTQFITVAVQPEAEEEEEERPSEEQPCRQRQPQLGQPPASPMHTDAAPEAAAGGFCIREDTLFLGGSGRDAAASPAAQAGGGLGAPAQHQPAPAASPAGLGFAIREDTQFVGLGLSGGRAAAAGAASPSWSSEAGGSTGDLLGAQLGGLPGADGSPAHSASVAQVSKWGFAPGADDTWALNLNMPGEGDTQALLDAVGAASAVPAAIPQHAWPRPLADGAARVGAGDSSGFLPGYAQGSPPTEDLALQMDMQGLQLADVKENVPQGECTPQPAGGSGRQLSDPAVAAAALQPLGEARVVALEVAVEADEAAEAALAEAATAGGAELAQQDSFEVWADPEEDGGGQQQHLRATPIAAIAEQQVVAAAAAAAVAGEEAGFVTPVVAQQPALVDPFSPTFHARMLSCLEPAVSQWPGVYCLSAEEEAAADAAFRAAGRSAAGLEELQLCGLEFAISGCIGEGSYARVYQGVDGDCADVALKHEAPPCPWEWYICKALASRLPVEAPADRARFIDPSALLLGARSSVLVAPLGPHGSLQELVNAHLSKGQAPLECLAMYLTADLLRTMQLLHAARIVHTDIKPDNLLVTLRQHSTGGDENAGPGLGLQLIDFGRSVDLDLLPPGAVLQGDSGTDAFRCVEMREGAPWLWQADAYGVAACAHVLLHGRYLEVERVRDSSTGSVSLRPVLPFKRQWAGELWGAFFHRLLNHTDPLAPPAVDDLVAGFEAHLSGSRDVAQRLRRELAAAASALPRRC